MHNNIKMLEIVSDGLMKCSNDFVYVGGAVASLYINDPNAVTIRSTLDVDCIVNIQNRTRFSSLEDELRRNGFSNCIEKGSPICRWKYKNQIVDIMPTNSMILGFSNKWYIEGIEEAIKIKLQNGNDILIFYVNKTWLD